MPKHYSVQLKVNQLVVREATGPQIRAAADIAKLFDDIVNLAQEAFFVATYDQKNKLIDKHLVSLGTLTASLVHPREVYRPAIMDGAAAVAFCHNHPSGDTTPSSEDKVITKRLREAGELLGIRVLDHVIVGRDGFFGFLESGLF